MSHRARKRFGQNFLCDIGIITQIVRCISPQAQETLIEIGPGKGALTKELLPLVKSVIGIELDRDLIPLLKRDCATPGNLTIISHDALSFDFRSLLNPPEKLRIVGNLPYNISTPLLFHLLADIDYIQDMHFMLQKEVVERLAAKANDSAYGQLTVLIQYHCQVENLLPVPPEAFSPQPKVESAFVGLTPHKKKTAVANNYQTFQTLVKKSFAHPRKTLRNNLKEFFTEKELADLPLDLSRRPQQLSVAEYVALSNHCGTIRVLNGASNHDR